jgi:hypothetical protein
VFQNSCTADVPITSTWQKLGSTLALANNSSSLRAQIYFSGAGNMDFDTAILTKSLLRSPSLEYAGTGWGAINPPGGTMNLVRYESAANAYDGTGYLEANTSIDGGSVSQDSTVNMQSGDSATFTMWARISPGSTLPDIVSLCVWSLNALANNCSDLELTNAWQPISTTYTVFGNTFQLRAQIYRFGRGNFDFDGGWLGDPNR